MLCVRVCVCVWVCECMREASVLDLKASLSCVFVSVSDTTHRYVHEVSRWFNMTFFTLRRWCPFLYAERVWTVFGVLKLFEVRTRGGHLDLFLYIYQFVFFLYNVQVYVYLNMLRVPEITSKPNEQSISLSLRQITQLVGTLPWSPPWGEGLTFSDFRNSRHVVFT